MSYSTVKDYMLSYFNLIGCIMDYFKVLVCTTGYFEVIGCIVGFESTLLPINVVGGMVHYRRSAFFHFILIFIVGSIVFIV